jgi:pimeloyl-ACP methyl ester carboxylesterase
MPVNAHPEQLRPPPVTRLAWEALTGRELARLLVAAPSLLGAPRGTTPVVVLPGFRTGDVSTFPLREFLRRLGHTVDGWGLGVNRGDVPTLIPRVAQEVASLARRHGEPLHLIGQSLGGVLARETARDRPELVAQVITIGSPVVGGPSYTRVAMAYPEQRLAEIRRGIAQRNRFPIRVPITAVYSKRDGIVAWEACIDRASPHVEHVEVSSSHLGMALDPTVWRLVAERLAQRGSS